MRVIPALVARVAGAWGRGDELEGWSLYWAQVYGYLADRLDANPALREAALVVRFEDMCRAPHETLQQVTDPLPARCAALVARGQGGSDPLSVVLPTAVHHG